MSELRQRKWKLVEFWRGFLYGFSLMWAYDYVKEKFRAMAAKRVAQLKGEK